MKKAIVTGANGFIGRYLIKELVNSECEVWSVIRNESEDISSIKEFNTHIVYCDLKEITKLPTIIESRGFDCFFHLAWSGSSGEERKNYDLQLSNAKFCVDTVEAASVLKCNRFIGAGSVTELMYRDYLYKDGSSPDAVTCYAIGKMAAEYLTRCKCVETGIEYIWTYIANFYGVGDSTQNFINFLINNYSEGNTPELTSGEQLADFMYVSDVAKALVCVGELGKDKNTYYLGYGNPRPLEEFVKIVRDCINPEIETGIGKKEFHGLNIDFDSIEVNKLHKDTGFNPEISFAEGIKLTLASLEKGRQVQ